jgi:hypothetical protein
MNAPFLFDLPPPWARSRDTRDWFALFREAEAEAEAAAEAVRTAGEAYRAARSPETEAAYRAADQRYDAARLRYQLESCQIVRGIKAIAGIARVLELADAGRGRMI